MSEWSWDNGKCCFFHRFVLLLGCEFVVLVHYVLLLLCAIGIFHS
jgi:hypothetical protein